jgi:RNA polymerase sigma-70 factor (sigma-E family)
MVQDALVPTGRDRSGAARGLSTPATAPTTFAECYAELRPEMVRLASAITGSPDIAQDLVQDAFVRLHGAWARVHDPRAYLRRAVVNACHSHHRRRRVERRHAALAGPESVGSLNANELSDALDALPYRQRAALVLRFYTDLSDVDIASTLGCRPGTVASLIHRGLEQLRRVIEP